MLPFKPLLLLSLTCALTACATTRDDLPTEADVDLQKYMGTWYEQARLPNRFQSDCVGDVQATYALRPDGTISVVNQCRTAENAIKTAQGEGRLAAEVSPPNAAKLEIRFAPAWTSWLPMVWGDYWIIRLHGDYEYSLVGTPDRKYLWVLSRHQQADPTVVEQLLSHAETLGFAGDRIIKSEKK